MNKLVTFFQVRDAAIKLSKICQTAQAHFEKKEPLQIVVPDKAALEFVDLLLWRFPEESFLPHIVATTPCSDCIIITCERAPLNEAKAFFNLCLPPLLNNKVKIIYDFDDFTSSDKKQASDKRFAAYRDAQFQIIHS
jgi:DNA polymerase IIIc chi subunit